MKMAETKLKQLKDQYESISTEDLTAIAFNKCQDALLSLYKANIKAMKDLETKSKEVKALKKKIDAVGVKEQELAATWLHEFKFQ